MIFLVGPAHAEPKTFTHEHFLYAVDYPDTWRLRRLNKAVSIASPAAAEDDFQENVQIVAEDLSKVHGGVTLMEYHRTGFKNAGKFLTDFKVLEEARTEWLGRETLVMLYTASVDGRRFKFKDYKFMVGATVYVLTYAAEPAGFDEHLEQAEAIMSSIRVSP